MQKKVAISTTLVLNLVIENLVPEPMLLSIMVPEFCAKQRSILKSSEMDGDVAQQLRALSALLEELR